ATWQRLQRMEQRLQRRLLEALEQQERERGRREQHRDRKFKDWFLPALEQRRGELLALPITHAGRRLSTQYETDCTQPISHGYCKNELGKLGVWKPNPRNSPKQRPK